jgi:hypothetical protein
MTKDEALKMAIEGYQKASEYRELKYYEVEALYACKEALEQPAQEPVALLEALSDLEHQQWMKWAKSIIDSEPISEARKQRWLTMMVDYKDLPDNIQEYDREWARKVMALYTHPHQWVGLTDDEIDLVWFEVVKENNFEGAGKYFARAIEQALKDKNT